MREKADTNNDSIVMFLKDISSSVLIVGVILFTIYLVSGTWPVVVAVESGSMETHIREGDVVFLLGTNRMNVTTYQKGAGIDYTTFEDYGDVIVYIPNGNTEATPIIHRAMFLIDEGEVMPNGRHAPHRGYITKGDNNMHYDQAGVLNPVKPEWIVGIAKYRVPYIGYVTLYMRHLVGL